MGIAEVDLLHQKLDILIDDFQSHKKYVHKIIGGVLLFLSSSMVVVMVELIKK